MASTQKKTTKGKKTPPRPEPPAYNGTARLVGGIVCLLLALCVLVSYFNVDALLLTFIAKALKGLLGWGFYLAAPALLGAALIAVGVFLSSLTDNQGFAAGISIALFLFNYFSVSLAENVSSTAFGAALAIAVLAFLLGMIVYYLTRSGNIAYAVGAGILAAALIILRFDSSGLEGLLPAVMKRLSLFERFYTFVNGIFDMTSIVFYLSVIVFCLFLTVQSLEKRRYN